MKSTHLPPGGAPTHKDLAGGARRRQPDRTHTKQFPVKNWNGLEYSIATWDKEEEALDPRDNLPAQPYSALDFLSAYKCHGFLATLIFCTFYSDLSYLSKSIVAPPPITNRILLLENPR